MRAKGVNKEQQLKYILECRNSGLTDYQWCQEHGIHPGTFYNWVSKLKKAGYADIPDPISRLNKKPIKHEIVKFEVTPDVVMADNLPEKMEQNACFSNEPSKDSVVEIVFSNATIRFVNNTNEMMIQFHIGRCHPLAQNRKGQYAVDLVHPYRLVFEKNGDKIQIANILEIVDYH